MSIASALDTRRHRVQMMWDAACWVFAALIATTLRFDGNPSADSLLHAALAGVILGVVQVLIGFLLMLYRGRYRLGSFDEVLGLVATAALVTVGGLLVVFLFQPAELPRSVPLIAAPIAVGLMLGARFAFRAYYERFAHARDGERTLVYGAGEAGESLVRQMLHTKGSAFKPVAYLDDNPQHRRRVHHGVSVQGTIADLETVAVRFHATVLVVAIVSVSKELLADLDKRCHALGLSLRVLPAEVHSLYGTVMLSDLAPVSEEDLLGRSVTEIDLTQIGQLIHGRRVLITGAGGSIGSELARQVYEFRPAALGLLDRDENGLHGTQLSIYGKALLDDDSTILASIRDISRLDRAFAEFKPDIVFHAAALKHLPLLEAAPDEAVKTNVIGTLNVLRASQRAGVATFVNISTDKAANPISVLGYSKRLAERLTSHVAKEATGTYVSVRFGNVLGSHGSVLLTFTGQIEAGGPVTVTHPDVTRYFMTIPEAVRLVLQAAAIGEDGEVLVLDMGEPVRIADVAQQLIDHSGKKVGILFTGLRPGEKLAEDLLGDGEADVRPNHPLVTQAQVPAIEPTELVALNTESSSAEIRMALRALARPSISTVRVEATVES